MELHTPATDPSTVNIPRRERSKLLEVVPEVEAVRDPETGKPRMVRDRKTGLMKKKMDTTGRWRLNGYYVGGKRVRRFYATESAARADLARLSIEAGNVDAKTRHALASRNDLVQDAIRAEALIKVHGLTLLESAREHAACLSALEPYGVGLRDVVASYVKTATARAKSVTIGNLFEKFIADRKRTKKSAVYLRDLKNRFQRFEVHFGSDFMASDVTPDSVAEWLTSLELSPVSLNNFQRNIGGAFNFAVKRGYIAENPFAGVAPTTTEKNPPAIFTPKEVSALLTNADPRLVPFLAIGFFAGLRPESELARMDWSQVDFESGLIKVTAKNKTARRRLVTMSDNLRAWLTPYMGTIGKVMPTNCRKLRVAAMRAANIKTWVPDVTRHSFASYHLATSENANKTALELGHSTTKTLFEHYRELVTPDAAKAFWKIRPATPAANVVKFERKAS